MSSRKLNILKKQAYKKEYSFDKQIDVNFSLGFEHACRHIVPLLKKALPIVSAHAESLHMLDGFNRKPDNEWDVLAKQIERVVK